MTIRGLVRPDCGRTEVDRHLKHDATCPLGRALDDQSAADRQWFETHPSRRQRRRPITPAEIAELRWHGWLPDGGRVAGDVVVTQLRPGVRARSYGEVVCWVRAA